MTPTTYWAAAGTAQNAPTIKNIIIPKPKSKGVDEIKKTLLIYFNSSESVLREGPQTDKNTYIRYMISYVLYIYTDETLVSIASWMNQHHTTIRRGRIKVEEQLNVRWHNKYKEDVASILTIISPSASTPEAGIKN
jgi:chromosomal replication initiation ATPase DnaA